MRIGVVSDTHRNREYLEKAIRFLVSKKKIATLYHLGDDYEDVSGLEDKYIEVVQIPGIYDNRYRSGELDAKQREIVLGLQIILVHSIDKDLGGEDILKSDIILHGHTHKEELRLEEGKLYMNPGHLKAELDRNRPPTFGFLSVMDREVIAIIYDLNFSELNSITLLRSESGLYKKS